MCVIEKVRERELEKEIERMMSVVRETERERYRDNGERERKGVIKRKIKGFSVD